MLQAVNGCRNRKSSSSGSRTSNNVRIPIGADARGVSSGPSNKQTRASPGTRPDDKRSKSSRPVEKSNDDVTQVWGTVLRPSRKRCCSACPSEVLSVKSLAVAC